MLSLLTAMIIILTSVLVYYGTHRNSNQPPGPWNLPILGYLHMLNPKEPYLTLMKLSQRYGFIFSLKLGVLDTVVLTDAKLIKKILIKDDVLGRPPLFLFELVTQNKGIIQSQGNLWREQRKFVSNFLRSFGVAKVSSKKKVLETLIMKNVQHFIYEVEACDSVLDPSDAVAYCMSSLSGTLFLGETFSREDKVWKTLLTRIDEISKLAAVAGPLNFLPILKYLPAYRRTMSMANCCKEACHKILDEFINESRKSFDANDSSPSNLIHAYLFQMSKSDSKEFYNIDQLRYLLFDVFAASIETTVNSILWGLLHLSAHQEVQDKVREELLQVLQGNQPQINDLPNLPYTEATIAETARITTVVPLGLPHCALQDMQIEGFSIRKGTMIMTPLWAIHMDPKIWKKPEEFCPERFLNDEGKFSQHESFLPFQAGKRMCVGDELAKWEIFLFFATVLQKFKFENWGTEPINLSAECGITLLPKPHKLVFKKI